ncbi:hypothetical protein M5K25_000186 [Dendrobium thyrsiflorum]|uniref:Uncharacterized protein n=1 Tax=Dendrobium thyrsiflorum TaxID=117978 RepID=A0ABD0W6R8_DENTH
MVELEGHVTRMLCTRISANREKYDNVSHKYASSATRKRSTSAVKHERYADITLRIKELENLLKALDEISAFFLLSTCCFHFQDVSNRYQSEYFGEMATKQVDDLEGEVEQIKSGIEEKFSTIEGRFLNMEGRFSSMEN